MRNHFTATKIHDVKAQVIVPLICFKQSAIRVWSKELETQYKYELTLKVYTTDFFLFA